MATGGPSAENAGADTASKNKNLTGGNSYAGISGPLAGVDKSGHPRPLDIGGNKSLPTSVSSPL